MKEEGGSRGLSEEGGQLPRPRVGGWLQRGAPHWRLNARCRVLYRSPSPLLWCLVPSPPPAGKDLSPPTLVAGVISTCKSWAQGLT